MNTFRRRERGSALIALFVSIVVCGAVSVGVLLTSGSRNKEAQTHLASERALQLAEAAADWGISQVRILRGAVPANSSTQTIAGVGTFTCRYVAGRPGDPTDSNYATIIATGTSASLSRTLQVVIKTQVVVPSFDAAVQLNVNVPIIDLSGNAFTIQGADHNMDGSLNTTSGTTKYGIASPAAVPDLAAQIGSQQVDNITGLGGTATTASIGQVPMIDLNGLFAQATAGATVVLRPGTIASNQTLGTATPGGTVLAYCNGDIKFSGNISGAGILAIDGDLDISGGVDWKGIIMVRGRVTMTGGGHSIRLLGALAVGQDITTNLSTTTIDATGTVDLEYSSAAVQMAADAYKVMVIASWGERANP
jgi:hypothetical protein